MLAARTTRLPALLTVATTLAASSFAQSATLGVTERLTPYIGEPIHVNTGELLVTPDGSCRSRRRERRHEAEVVLLGGARMSEALEHQQRPVRPSRSPSSSPTA